MPSPTLQNVVVHSCILWDGSKLSWWDYEIPLNVQIICLLPVIVCWGFLLVFFLI